MLNNNRPRSSTLNRLNMVRSHSALSTNYYLDEGSSNVDMNNYSNFQQQYERISSSLNNSALSPSATRDSPAALLPSFSSLSSTTNNYNNYMKGRELFFRRRTEDLQSPTPNSAQSPSNSHHHHQNGSSTSRDVNTNSDNVQYAPYNKRRGSIFNIKRSSTPPTLSTTTYPLPSPSSSSSSNHSHTLRDIMITNNQHHHHFNSNNTNSTNTGTTITQLHQHYPPQQSVSITNIPFTTAKNSEVILLNQLSIPPTNSTAAAENVIVRVPTARRRVEKPSTTLKSSPKSSSSSSLSPSSGVGTSNKLFTTTTNSSSTTIGSTTSSSTIASTKPKLFQAASGSNLLNNNRPRSSTPTSMKRSTSLGKLPPRERTRTISPSPSVVNSTLSTPTFSTNALSNTSMSSHGSSGKKKKISKTKKVTPPSLSPLIAVAPGKPTTLNMSPKNLKNLVELRAKQAKIEILSMDDYLDSSRVSKVDEIMPPTKDKLLSILMDINLKYNVSVTSPSHPNCDYYTSDKDVFKVMRERQAYMVETRYGKLMNPIDECGIQFEGAYFGRYSFLFNINTNYFSYHSWSLIMRVYLDSDSSTVCVFGEKYCWFTLDINNIKMNNQEFHRTIGGMKMNEWNEIFVSLNMLQKATQNREITGRQILAWVNGVQTVIPIESEVQLKVKPGENKSLNFINLLNGRALRGSISSIILLNKACESMEELVKTGKSFLKNHTKTEQKPSLIMLTHTKPLNQGDNEELVFADPILNQ